MRHVKAATDDVMEIDHHNPTLKGVRRNKYSNLYPAVSRCNGSKQDNWPTLAERREGIRFLDPCAEHDYENHIWENPKTHKLVATSPAGSYHIDFCDLNNPSFVEERRKRAYLRYRWKNGNLEMKSQEFDLLAQYLTMTKDIVDDLMPDIAAPPAGAVIYTSDDQEEAYYANMSPVPEA